MLLIVGLGNPGVKYQNNRHNVGHLFMDYLIKSLQIPSSKSQAPNKSQNPNFKLFKTNCYMNVSGIFVKKLTNHYSLTTNHLIVIHDDLDIPLGKFHIQFASGPQLHNGLTSVEQHLKTKDFWRVRIGVDNRRPKNYLSRTYDQDNNKQKWVEGEKYSLQNFLAQEKKILETEIFPKIFEQLKLYLKNQFKIII